MDAHQPRLPPSQRHVRVAAGDAVISRACGTQPRRSPRGRPRRGFTASARSPASPTRACLLTGNDEAGPERAQGSCPTRSRLRHDLDCDRRAAASHRRHRRRQHPVGSLPIYNFVRHRWRIPISPQLQRWGVGDGIRYNVGCDKGADAQPQLRRSPPGRRLSVDGIVCRRGIRQYSRAAVDRLWHHVDRHRRPCCCASFAVSV